MSAMADMSRAVLGVLEAHSGNGTIQTVPTEELDEFVQIVGAFYLDMKDELAKRRLVAA